ncbi:MAG TPA: hypothetical protein VGG39_23595 [Polyangiaceae bacterium]|jgi:hypothetical protein
MKNNGDSTKATGECFCGCGTKVNEGIYFAPGHDKKAEGMLTRLQYGEENPVLLRLIAAGYGPGKKNLSEAHSAMMHATAAGKLDHFALVSLNDMARQHGVAEAVVFTGEAGKPWEPAKKPGGNPQPLRSSTLDVPFLGTVVAQGFGTTLTDEEKAIVQARFKGRAHMWLSNS